MHDILLRLWYLLIIMKYKMYSRLKNTAPFKDFFINKMQEILDLFSLIAVSLSSIILN